MSLLDESRRPGYVGSGHARALEEGEAWGLGARGHQDRAVYVDSGSYNVWFDLGQYLVADLGGSAAGEACECVRAWAIGVEFLASSSVYRNGLGGGSGHG